MTSGTTMAEIAALIGDPGRSNMLGALLGGRALTATELAAAAGVSPSRRANIWRSLLRAA